ncbi:MAG: hypothetical protein ACOZIN_20275 [Myxococcota bacterium]
MNENELLATSVQTIVPAAFAEKAMGSLMQLHSELMEEKERRVDLYRRLMEKEQAIAELRMYVKLLEDKAGMGAVPKPEAAHAPVTPPPSPSPRLVRNDEPAPRAIPLPRVMSPPPAPTPKRPAANDGWKTW